MRSLIYSFIYIGIQPTYVVFCSVLGTVLGAGDIKRIKPKQSRLKQTASAP